MIFVTLAYGFCAFTQADMAFLGKVDGGRCVIEIGAGGDPPSNIGTDVDGHAIEVTWLGNDQAEVIIDGKSTMIGPRT